MATNTTTVKIDGDASGLKGASKQGQDALKGLGKTTEAQGQKLGLYGEKLGKAFGPGEGLHGTLDSLESPIRDSEGAFARASQAALTFGNEGASATDKISAGFLLVGDSIASFVSGGAIGLAVAASVAGIAMLVDTMNSESEASKAAAEAAKEHADALNALAKAAAAANITVSLQRAKEREKEVRERVRFIDEERRTVKKQFLDLQEDYFGHLEELKGLQNANVLTGRGARKRQLEAQKAADKAELETLKAKFKKLDTEYSFSYAKISKANEDVANETAANQEHEITKLVAFLDKVTGATTKAIEKEAKKRSVAVETFAQRMDRAAKSDKERTEAQKALRLEDEAFEERLAKRREERGKAARERLLENSADFHEANVELFKKRAKEEERLANVQKRIEGDLASLRQGALSSFTDGLSQMAHDGEVNFAKLADSVLASTGKQLVSRGTLHLFEGLAATFGGNPAGAAQAAVGGKMIAAGLVMGAVGGAVGRAGAPPSEKKSSTPTDTRKSAAASSSSGGSGGGTTVINFNGPAYDKRGVSQVVTSGQRMAKHRRVQGA